MLGRLSRPTDRRLRTLCRADRASGQRLSSNGGSTAPMATTINKQRTLNHLVTAPDLAGTVPVEALPVLEQFIYAVCRENSTPEQAQQAYGNLRKRFFDWNE